VIANLTPEHMHFRLFWYLPHSDNDHRRAAFLTHRSRGCLIDPCHSDPTRAARRALDLTISPTLLARADEVCFNGFSVDNELELSVGL